jgi:hypothetical protein
LFAGEGMAGGAPSSETTRDPRGVFIRALPGLLLFYACRYSYPAL